MGAPRGVRQSGRPANYDPASGAPYRPGPTFRGKEATKLIQASEALDISASELLNELIRRMNIDDSEGGTGLPDWADEYLSTRHPRAQMKLIVG